MKRRRKKKKTSKLFSVNSYQKNALSNDIDKDIDDKPKSKRKKRASKKKKRIKIIVSAIIVLLIISIGSFIKNSIKEQRELAEQNQTGKIIKENAEKKNVDEEGNEIAKDVKIDIHFINVGQGSAVLIDNGETDVLIDAGNQGDAVSSYIGDYVNGPLEYVINTNASSDYLGGLTNIYNAYKVENTIYGNRNNSAEFKEFLKTAKKNSKVKVASNQTIDLGSGAALDVFKTTKSKKEGAVCVLSYKDNTFIITGNASKDTMKRLKGKYSNVTVYLVNNSGTTTHPEDVIAEWKPQYAIISSSHPTSNNGTSPSKECIDIVNKHCSQIFSTYKSGTIKFTIDNQGLDLSIDQNTRISPEDYNK